MTTIGTVFPAHIFVAQAEVRLVADQSADAAPATIKADQQALADAEQQAASDARHRVQVDRAQVDKVS